MAEIDPFQINAYSVEQLYQFMQEEGGPTMEDYRNCGLNYKKRDELEKLIKAKEKEKYLLLDNEEWEKARKANTVASYDAYLNLEWPEDYEAQHTAEAKNAKYAIEAETIVKTDDELWVAAQNARTPEAFASYINHVWPAGYTPAHLEEAKATKQRLEIEKIENEKAIAKAISEDDALWNAAVRDHTVAGYNIYINNNWPAGYNPKHLTEANFKKQQIVNAMEQAKSELLNDLSQNPWKYNQAVMKLLFNPANVNKDMLDELGQTNPVLRDFLAGGGRLRHQDLIDKKIIPPGISQIDITNPDCQLPSRMYSEMGKYPTDRTDVFFLGVPRSGKSSVLSGVIYRLWKEGLGSYVPHRAEDGRDPCRLYFDGLVQCLGSKKPPMGTPTDKMSFMKVDIKEDKNDSRFHDVTILELSGESFNMIANSTVSANDVWRELGASAVLSNNNRKLLFLIVDYSFRDNKTMDRGDMNTTVQSATLERAIDVFTTDGKGSSDGKEGCTLSKVDTLAIIVTKSDLMGTDNRDEQYELARDYIMSSFQAVWNKLISNSKRYGINANNPMGSYEPYILTFSLGKFYPGNTVLFDPQDSGTIIDFMASTTRARKEGGPWWKIF